MRYRPYVPSDREEWRRMRRALWGDEAAADGDLDAWLIRPDAVVIVAERPGGRLCGFVEAATRPYAEGCDTSPVAFLEGWFVDDDVRRRGVGRALVEAVERWAEAQGLSELASDALLDNDISHAAHLRLAFEEVERIVCFRKPIGRRPPVASTSAPRSAKSSSR
jgi:aminoglycoside 6'-N-acetyltransferase I